MATSLPTREGRVAVPGGTIWYKVVGDGAATPLVTVHGGPGFTHDYFEPLEALADERPVVFYDQLGAGKSDKPDDVSLWHNDRFVAELAALIDALGYERIHLLGQSWGTLLAAAYALRHPDRLVGLVLSSPVLRCAPNSHLRSRPCSIGTRQPAPPTPRSTRGQRWCSIAATSAASIRGPSRGCAV